MNQRIYLSPPQVGPKEMAFVEDAIQSGWIAPLGPHVDAFEQEVAERTGVRHAVALSSGTAAIHLALRILGVGPGDEVLCPTLTFCATANPIVYEGAKPVFVDVDRATWTIDPTLVAEELAAAAARGKPPRAVIAVDLYGQCADYDALSEACALYDVPLLQDAAEALGASYRGRAAGCCGRAGIFSFNGNKIITTSGGGMLVSDDEQLVERARFLATQARDPAPHYQHSAIGFNYRLSNVLAALGRAQLAQLDKRVAARRKVFERYAKFLYDLPGLTFMPEATYGTSNRWLSCITIDPAAFGSSREEVRLALEAANIEARPVWKPLHMQPVFAGARARGGRVAEHLFDTGLCLPSGSTLSEFHQHRVIDIVRSHCRAR